MRSRWWRHPWAWLVNDPGFDWLYPSVYRTTLMGGPVWEDVQ